MKYILSLLLLICTTALHAQQSLIQVNGWNAYVHLPAAYNFTTINYPVIIFFPGIGEVGSVDTLVIKNGPGAYIKQGWNGNVTIDGGTVEFIVVSLQPLSAYPSEATMNAKIQALRSMYRIDPTGIFLTGLSHGGWCSSTFVSGDPYGGPYTYASQINAIVTVQGVRPDDNQPYPDLFDNFAPTGRWLCFEQRLDGRDGITAINRMNLTHPGSGIFIQTDFNGGGHCCWRNYYGGGGMEPGKWWIDGKYQNIYEWFGRRCYHPVLSTDPTPPGPTRTRTPFLQYDRYKITLKANRGDKYTIQNMMGQLLLSGSYKAGKNEISISMLPMGMYVLRTGQGHFKIIKY